MKPVQNKVYVENSRETKYRIEHTKSKKGFNKFCYDWNARPVFVRISGYDTHGMDMPKAAKRHVFKWHQHHQSMHVIYTSDLYECFDDKYHFAYTLSYKGKPLTRRTIPLIEYNIRDGDTIDYSCEGLIGGSKMSDYSIFKSFLAFLTVYYAFIFDTPTCVS